MQPYFLPYIGYFQLLSLVDEFVFYDDVKYIKQGWINRNQIWVNGSPFLFTVPIRLERSNQLIRDTLINEIEFKSWLPKFEKTLIQNYKKSIFLESILELLQKVWEHQPNLAAMARSSIEECANLIGIDTKFRRSSVHYPNAKFQSQSRIWEICRMAEAQTYLNLSGGQKLYNKDEFLSKGIDLKFIQTRKDLF